MITKIRYVLPAAIRCFFHVYEERLGTYGFSVRKHVLLVSPWKTACGRDVGFDEEVTVGNDDIVVDRDWCLTCAAAVNSKLRRDLAQTAQRAAPSPENA